jgi:DNA gyrase subunit A
MDKVAELMKAGKLREISDMRDETDLSGLKLTIDLKRGTDPDKLMAKLMKLTPLCDPFSCNFNILIGGSPRVWACGRSSRSGRPGAPTAWKRRVWYDLTKRKEKLHLLKGLSKILLDIDKAIRLIRETEHEADVVPNLMIGFGIDEAQAEFVAEIKLRNINREYILKRVEETDALEKEIADLEDTLASRRRIRAIITGELREVMKKYPAPRRSGVVYADEEEVIPEEETVADYPVTLFLSREGYFKKITAQSLRMSSEQKYKENDALRRSFEASNRGELLIFTDRQQCYKARVADFEDTKASALGTYLPGKLGFDEGESVVDMLDPGDYTQHVLLFYENGRVARVPLRAMRPGEPPPL